MGKKVLFMVCFVAGLGLMLNPACASLVVHYGFDETGGNTAQDSTGGNDGTLKIMEGFSYNWAPGDPSPVGSGHLENKDGVVLVPGLGTAVGDFTLSVWVNKIPYASDGTGSGKYATLFSVLANPSDVWGSIGELILEEKGHVGEATMGLNGGEAEYTEDTGLLEGYDSNDGTWRNITLVRDGTSGIVMMYLDAATSYNFDVGAGPVDMTNFRLGNTNPGSNRNFAGGFDDFGFWDEMLPVGAPGDAAGQSVYGVFENGVVPEPATMILLGMGGLAMLRRRR